MYKFTFFALGAAMIFFAWVIAALVRYSWPYITVSHIWVYPLAYGPVVILVYFLCHWGERLWRKAQSI